MRVAFVSAVLCVSHVTSCEAAQPSVHTNGRATAPAPQSDVRSGGVLEESFGYHRKTDAALSAQHPTIAPTGGWYGYGFPVKGYRWGWFGAGHYYPRVLWHRGYNGDHYRWSYRRGY
jgi:hypothetical protein